MKANQNFQESQIPYAILAKFGLTKNMIDDMPQAVMSKFLDGKETPVLPVVYDNKRGERIRSYARLALTKLEDGKTDVVFIPQWKTSKLDSFDMLQQQALVNGDVAITEMPNVGRCYIQYDDTTNQVFSVPEDIINQNLKIYAFRYDLNSDDEYYLHQGKPFQFPDANNKMNNVTIGINLKEDKGVQVTKGDVEQWHKEKNSSNLPKYNFGENGCWVADEDGELEYVDNEHFTEEMKEEMKKMALRNATKANLNANGMTL